MQKKNGKKQKRMNFVMMVMIYGLHCASEKSTRFFFVAAVVWAVHRKGFVVFALAGYRQDRLAFFFMRHL